MDTDQLTDKFLGLFERRADRGAHSAKGTGAKELRTLPDPQTGRPLQVAAIELTDRSVCPSCTQLGAGGYVSFVADLRLAFACQSCRKLVWIVGA